MNHIAWLLPLALATLVPNNASSEESVAQPRLRFGDSWTFRDVDLQKNEELSSYEIRIVDVWNDRLRLGKKIITSTNSTDVGKLFVYEADATTWTGDNSRIIEGKPIALAFPLYVGKTWDYQYRMPSMNDTKGELYKVTAKVEKWEDVQTPAGTFNALKVVHEGTWSRTFFGESVAGVTRETFWYAPDVKRWVKQEWLLRDAIGRVVSNSVQEITKFGFTGGPPEISVKSGESADLGEVYWINGACLSILKAFLGVEILEGPAGVSLKIREEDIHPARAQCANSTVRGGVVVATVGNVTEKTTATLHYRVRYSVPDGEKQTTHTRVLNLNP
jgi:hypothetical protein